MQLESPIGSAEGDGELRRTEHLFHARWQTEQPNELLATFVTVPGTFEGGRLSGTLTARGGPARAVALAEGEFLLVGARFVSPHGPAEGGLPPMAITNLRGDFRQENGQMSLRNMAMTSPLISARAEIDFLADGPPDRALAVRAGIEVTDLGRFLDQWPLFAGRVRGGVMHADLELTGDMEDWSQTSGGAALTATGGLLLIPDMEARFDRARFSPLTATLTWDPAGTTIRSLSVRGDKYNVDATGFVPRGGELAVRGKAWLTKSFGRSLIPNGPVGWLGRLLGVIPNRFDSGFRLAGSFRQPRLTMGITRSPVWKYARRELTRPLELMATGRLPIWDLTLPSDTRTADRHGSPAPPVTSLRDPAPAAAFE
jgi:hypothetical protein